MNGGWVESSSDEILLSPGEGVFDWAADYAGGNRLMNDHFSYTKLSDKPITIELALNYAYRFDKPGKYSVKIQTNRVETGDVGGKNRARISLTTNEVNFEIKEMNETEELAEVKRLSALLDAKPALSEETKISEQLSFLSGDASTREKVKRYLDGQGRSGNYHQNFFYGLFIAKNRALAVKLLEEALRDTNREANFSLLGMLVRLRVLQENRLETAASRPEIFLQPEDTRSAEIRQGYLKELVESLPKRSGKNLTATAIAILQSFPRDRATKMPPTDVMVKVRRILLKKFDEMDILQREYLLSAYWEELRDESLAASIERMLTDKNLPQTYSHNVRTTALKRLIEISQEKARPLVIAEIRDPNSFVSAEVLSAIDDKFLPETDDALLEQIRDLAQLKTKNRDFVLLKNKALLAARFATANIYASLLEVYKTYGDAWQTDARGGLLGYFARHNEREGVFLIEQALAKTNPGHEFGFFLDLTKMNYPPALDDFMRERLASEDLEKAGTAAYLMSKYGSETGREAIQTRLNRWVKQWSGRAAQLDAEDADDRIKSQAMFQVNMIEALMLAKAWKLSDAELRQLKQSCLTEACRRRFPAQ